MGLAVYLISPFCSNPPYGDSSHQCLQTSSEPSYRAAAHFQRWQRGLFALRTTWKPGLGWPKLVGLLRMFWATLNALSAAFSTLLASDARLRIDKYWFQGHALFAFRTSATLASICWVAPCLSYFSGTGTDCGSMTIRLLILRHIAMVITFERPAGHTTRIYLRIYLRIYRSIDLSIYMGKTIV